MAVAAAIKTMSDMGNSPFESGTLKSFFDELGGLYAGRHDVVHPFLELVEKVENHLGHVLDDHAAIEAHHIGHAHETEEKLFRKTFDYTTKELGRNDVGEDNSHHYNGDDNTTTKIARTEVVVTPEGKKNERENRNLFELLRYLDTANNNAAKIRALEQRLTEIRNEIQRLREENEKHEKALKSIDKAQRLLDDSDLNDQTKEGQEKREKLENRLEKADIPMSQFQNADGTIDIARLEEETRRQEEQRLQKIKENNQKIEGLGKKYSQIESEIRTLKGNEKDDPQQYAKTMPEASPPPALNNIPVSDGTNGMNPPSEIDIEHETSTASLMQKEIESLESEAVDERSLMEKFKTFAAGLMETDEAPAAENNDNLAANDDHYEEQNEIASATSTQESATILPLSSVASSGQRSLRSFADDGQEYQPSYMAASFVQASNPVATPSPEPIQTAPEYKATGDVWKRQAQFGMAA